MRGAGVCEGVGRGEEDVYMKDVDVWSNKTSSPGGVWQRYEGVFFYVWGGYERLVFKDVG